MMDDYEIVEKLEELIKENSASSLATDWFIVLEELEAEGVPQIKVRKALKKLGFVITEYGALQGVIPCAD